MSIWLTTVVNPVYLQNYVKCDKICDIANYLICLWKIFRRRSPPSYMEEKIMTYIENLTKSKGIKRILRADGLWNFEKPDGTFLCKEWFSKVEDFATSFTIVEMKGVEYKLKTDGTLTKKR